MIVSHSVRCKIDMAEADDIIVNMELGESPLMCAPEAFSVVPEDDIHKIEIKQRENGQSRKKYSQSQIPSHQRKDLYMKLDDILLSALHQHFEFCPGNSIDRLEMVDFLTSVVHQHLDECPELQKILDLRDTVLTGRIKRAFPGVEYKRKQVKEDHYRKVWLYVNIRRRCSGTPDCSASETATDISETSPETTLTMTLSPPSLHTGKDHSPCLYSSSEDSSYLYSDNGFDSMPSHDGPFDREVRLGDRTGLALDDLTLQKWIVSHYKQDNVSYVPVQDVVKALKKDFNVEVSYKECHQLILSAFSSCKNRVARKTVRVGSVGQQYVYRGIAPLNKPVWSSGETQDPDETEFAHSINQSENDAEEESEEAWKRKIRDITEERDQALMERNQALAALMELEKEHAEAMRTIKSLREENFRQRSVENRSRSLKDETIKRNSEMNRGFNVGGHSSNVGNFLLKFGDTKRYKTRDGECDRNIDVGQNNVFSHGQCDYSLLKEVVTQAKEERDYLLKRLEIVKGERNSYLERLHALEKESQRLRDSVSMRHTDLFQNGLLDEISLHFQTNCQDENNAKEALSSVLSHLRSKRKQVTPSRLNKSPKYDHTNVNERSSVEDRGPHSEECSSPASAKDSGISSPWKPDVSNVDLHNGGERLCNTDVGKISINTERNLGGEDRQSEDESLIVTSGSSMIGFKRHPLED